MIEPPLLTLADIRLTFGGDAIFDNVALIVEPRARIAMVGRNGCGKSTLLKIAAGMIEPDAGELFVKPGAAVSYLPQEPDLSAFATVGDYVEAGLPPDANPHSAWLMLGELGLDPEGKTVTLSGGEARRAAIVRALSSEPDILLLDEPTNHLDLPAIAWLEQRLRASSAAIVVISHDRRFLETLTTETVWIDRGKSRRFDHGFATFEEARDKILEEEELERHKLGRKIVAEEHWIRYGVTARRKRNMRRVRELADLRKQHRDTKRAPSAVKMQSAKSDASGKRVIVAESISKSFDANDVIRDFSIKIARGEKIGVVGPNGAGKTTLLNILTGVLQPDTGTVTIGSNVNVVTLDQRRDSLKPDTRLVDAITDHKGDWVTVAGEKRHASSYLQDFLFAPEQWRAPVKSLSGGERGRLALAIALTKPANLLVLDEPTNDLDLETLDLLEEMLLNYQDTLLLVSHDRSFLDRIVTSVITTDPQTPGVWRRYAGGYDDMVAQRGSAPGLEKSAKRTPDKKPKSSPPAQSKTPSSKLSYKEKYALETLPGEIDALQSKIATLQKALADPTLFERDPEEFQKTAASLEESEHALADAEEKWLMLEMKREELEGGSA